jgi:hypothetical protein
MPTSRLAASSLPSNVFGGFQNLVAEFPNEQILFAKSSCLVPHRLPVS